MNNLYDNQHGIMEYLTDLDGLNRLIQDRYEAGYNRKEKLHDFIIMGSWMTDSCGNFGRCEFSLDHKKVDSLPIKMPIIATPTYFYDLFPKLNISTYIESNAPKKHLICSECNKGWNIDNAWNCSVYTEDRVVSLLAGHSIAQAEELLNCNSEGVFRFGSEPSVRNNKFIDLNPHPQYKDRVVNEKGWRYHHPPFNHEIITKQYIAEEGDDAIVTVYHYEHKRCRDIRKARTQRIMFEKTFAMAGFKDVYLVETKNQYCPCDVCAPWYCARLPFGDIVIGWRKRVINIDWSATGRDLSKVFGDEEVTKGKDFIHAHGTEAAVDYLSRIREHFE